METERTCFAQVRDVAHENNVRFIGACIECPMVLILTEYCPKGSLKDVLDNDALQLDWNFRMSLIHDIVKVDSPFWDYFASLESNQAVSLAAEYEIRNIVSVLHQKVAFYKILNIGIIKN